MASRISNLFFLVSLTLVAVPNVAFVSSQTGTPNNFNGSYKVHVGETKRFDVINTTPAMINFLSFRFDFQNKTYLMSQLNPGDQIIVKITAINSSSFGYGSVSSLTTIVTAHQTLQLPLLDTSSFVQPAFNSYADAQSFFNQTNSNTNFTQNGAVIILSQTDISGTGSNANNSPTFYHVTSFNWRTGWLESINTTAVFSNGTYYWDVVLQQHTSHNLVSTFFSFVDIFFEIGSLFVVVIAIAMLVWIYRSYTKISKTSPNSQSFIHYLKNRFTYHKNDTPNRPSNETDKALKTIESILEETTNDDKY